LGSATRQRRPASLVRELPADERPRERLLSNGSETLSDVELVAVLLRTGRPGRSVLDLARDLLHSTQGLSGLLGVGPLVLQNAGLGPANAAGLLAAVELARRFTRARVADRELLRDPQAVASYLGLRYSLKGQEVMGALYLDTRNRLLGETELYRGTLSRAAVEPRAILKEGLLRDAAGVVLFHTHPSGDPSPSAEDLGFTRRMVEAGQLIGLQLVDHLVLGAGGTWTSLRRRGLL
jgi:DNA repair protein RadC